MNGELYIEEDGDICIDWRTPGGDRLSISFCADGNVFWTARISGGNGKHARMANGCKKFAPEVFEVLAKLVEPVAAGLGVSDR